QAFAERMSHLDAFGGANLAVFFEPVAVARLLHLFDVARRKARDTFGDRPAFNFVSIEERRAAPPLHGGVELPRKIDGIADTGVHAKPTGRRRQMACIAADKHAI